MFKNYRLPLLCLLPFMGVALWFVSGQNLGNFLTFGLVLACPLSHFFLMGGGHHDHRHSKEEKGGGD